MSAYPILAFLEYSTGAISNSTFWFLGGPLQKFIHIYIYTYIHMICFIYIFKIIQCMMLCCVPIDAMKLSGSGVHYHGEHLLHLLLLGGWIGLDRISWSESQCKPPFNHFIGLEEGRILKGMIKGQWSHVFQMFQDVFRSSWFFFQLVIDESSWNSDTLPLNHVRLPWTTSYHQFKK